MDNATKMIWAEGIIEILHEHRIDEYCEAIQCQQYNAGEFSFRCEHCEAFAYYKWLKESGYRLLRVRSLPKDETE